ncbi:MAG TPA: nuclear transport factor 2 family protein [Usitatibacter sp.]|nr:nuclear transport factor 2 family protein [Usitatibacter sp.]
MKSIRSLFLAFALLPLGALASTGEATAHFDAIAKGDLAALKSQYSEHVVLEWVGGPLDGTYKGAAQVAELWKKFTHANPDLQVKVADLKEATNDKGSTVTANVLYGGKSRIKVRYVLTYRDGKIAAETWQVDPKLEFGS